MSEEKAAITLFLHILSMRGITYNDYNLRLLLSWLQKHGSDPEIQETSHSSADTPQPHPPCLRRGKNASCASRMHNAGQETTQHAAHRPAAPPGRRAPPLSHPPPPAEAGGGERRERGVGRHPPQLGRSTGRASAHPVHGF